MRDGPPPWACELGETPQAATPPPQGATAARAARPIRDLRAPAARGGRRASRAVSCRRGPALPPRLRVRPLRGLRHAVAARHRGTRVEGPRAEAGAAGRGPLVAAVQRADLLR